jgi:hypothetical protein
MFYEQLFSCTEYITIDLAVSTYMDAISASEIAMAVEPSPDTILP